MKLKKAIYIFLIVVIQITSFPGFSSAQGTIATPEANLSVDPVVVGDDIDYFSNLTQENEAVLEGLEQNLPGVANLKQPIKVRELVRKDLKADESATVVVENARVEDLEIKVFDFNGNNVNLDIETISSEDPVIVKIHPSIQNKPGRYRIKIKDLQNEIFTQEFTWGVLAINTNKSIYSTKETASIQMAVLDDTGEMVCDSNMELVIKNPKSEITTLTTKAGSIIVNPECYSKDFTLVPDYQASYETGDEGIYNLSLTATTPDGSYTIRDSFEVKNNQDFYVERSAPTRIYPPLTYPATLTITANKDFSGVVKDFVPSSFTVTKNTAEGVTSFDSVQTDISTSDKSVLGAEVYNIGKPFTGDYELTLGFGGQHRDPNVKTKYTQFGVLGHDGVDFALPMDTPVIAVDDGQVVKAKPDSDYGTTIVIEHSWGKSYYGHLDKILKTEGTKVKKGEIIALSGDSGLSSGPHLHFGIKPNENDFNNGFYGKINPLPFLGIADNGASHGRVAGASSATTPENKNGIQVISWNVSLKKGETITLGYSFDAPDISPELYLLGPLELNENNVKVFAETRHWQIAVDAVVVNGGIVTSEAQFGGLQRKLVRASNDSWYAFLNDGTDVKYSKSSNGVTWGAPVDIDATDADNYNPSISVSGAIIHIFWMDESADLVEGKQLDTATDTLGTLCQLASPGAFTVSSYFPTVASLSTTAAIVVYSDSSTGTNEGAYEVTGLNGACAGTALATGNTFPATPQFGWAFSDSDRPVAVTTSSTTGGVVFQDGDLSWSYYDASLDEWQNQNTTIASVTDNIYSVATDGTSIWVLTVDTVQNDEVRLYKCCTADIAENQIDPDAGGNDDDGDSDINMFCPTEDNCKIVYTDDIDTATPTLKFVDCNDTNCSSPVVTTLDTDIGAAGDQAGASVHCVSDGDGVVSDNCKVAYGDTMDTTTPLLIMIDCVDDEDCSTNSASGSIDTDLGGSTSILHTSINCPSDTNCKILYIDSGISDVFFVDCSSATCNTRDAITQIDSNAGANANLDLDCSPGSTNCKIIYHDNSATGGCADANSLCFRDCSTEACTNTGTFVDTDIGSTSGASPMSIDCLGSDTDCKILYGDGTAGDLFFVDCPDATCTSTGRTITQIDATGGATTSLFYHVSMDCVSATDCKFIYVGETTGGAEDAYFGDCDDATCSTGSVYDLPGPRFGGAVQALTSANSKIVYYDGTSASAPTVQFADCDTEDCLPTWSTLTSPFTGQSNLISASLTYDSTNSDLYASVIKDASELAYWKSSDATTISWGSETDFGFTPAGDLDNISTPAISAGLCSVGAVLRQGTNVEFNYASSSCLPSGPTLEETMRHGKWFSGGAEQPFTF